LVLSGVGLAQIFVPLTVTVLSGVEPREVPAAAAFFNLSRQLGGSIAIAVLVTVLAHDAALYQERLGAGITLGSPAVTRYVHARGGLSENTRSNLAAMVAAQASVLAYADTARFTGFVSLLFVPLALVLRRPHLGPRAVMEAE
jgi:DHA2 family multidrug resistance protein